MTPDSTPIVGATQVKGLFLNTGYGTLGWTMAAGSGRLVADLYLAAGPTSMPRALASTAMAVRRCCDCKPDLRCNPAIAR